jgi:N-dimethylarginine dimethylaminohydrolase
LRSANAAAILVLAQFGLVSGGLKHVAGVEDVVAEELVHATVESVRSRTPDMTFVAHGAVVNYGVAALSCFAHSQRTAEEDHLQTWLEEAGFIVWKSEGLPLEGEGDALFSPDGKRLWAAHGSRTSIQSHNRLSNVWHIEVTSLQLVDPRFYHLDLCFIPLSRGHVLYYPGAFDRRFIEKIESVYSRRKEVGSESGCWGMDRGGIARGGLGLDAS